MLPRLAHRSVWTGLQQTRQHRVRELASITKQGASAWTYAIYLPAAISGYLCFWQLRRMEEKADVVRRAASVLHSAEVPLRTGLPEFQPVVVEGEFEPSRGSVMVGPRPKVVQNSLQIGYVLLQPFKDTASGLHVMVNRGWVPKAWREQPELAAASAPAAPVCVRGVVQHSEKPSAFVPANNLETGEFFWFEAPAMARYCGLPHSTPLVQVVAPAGAGPDREVTPPPYPLPKARHEVVRFSVTPSGHAGYAAVWGVLAVACGLMAHRATRGRRTYAKQPR